MEGPNDHMQDEEEGEELSNKLSADWKIMADK